MNALELVTEAVDRIGYSRPDALVDATLPDPRTFLALLNREGRALVRRHDWQVLTREHTFSSVNGTEGYSLPSDYDRMVAGTFFNRTERRPVVGPLSPPDWQDNKARLVTRVTDTFRLRGGSILLMPTPSSAESFYFEYVSKNWVGSFAADLFAADTDTCVFDDELMILGVMWRWLSSRRLDYAQEFQDYEAELAKRILADLTPLKIDAATEQAIRNPRPPEAPETLIFS